MDLVKCEGNEIQLLQKYVIHFILIISNITNKSTGTNHFNP